MIGKTPELIKDFYSKYNPSGKNVLEVGSLDVNGNIKDLLLERYSNYIGIDMRDGANVDMVVDGHDIKKHFKKESFDLVICIDTLEHDSKFWLTVENMRWVLKKGGWLILGAPSLKHPRHNHPYDYYRFFKSAFEVFLKGYKDVYTVEQTYSGDNADLPDQVYGWGRKP